MLEQILTVGFVTAFLTASVRMAVPLIYAGLGETISEKAGILNIGMEGVMLGGAFFSFAGTFYSGSLAVGLLCGMAGGAMVSAIHGLLSIRLAQDQSVSGIAINIFMAGVTSFLYKLMSSGQSYQQIEPFAKLKIPFLGDIIEILPGLMPKVIPLGYTMPTPGTSLAVIPSMEITCS